ncbi:MAG: dihydroorotase [Candidatus Aminicenantes bacterium]|nr:dihydroorotase [Candidatus Aminicenantes bacterium]
MKLLLKKGWVLDPGEKIDGQFDLLVVDGKIAEIKPEIDIPVDKIIEVSGLIVAPGFIDLHAHLREPGFEHKETIASGSRAAARGGFTTVCCMPNTNPVNDSPEITRFIKAKAEKESPVNVLPIAAVTKNQKGQELAPLSELVAAGAVAFSDDGQPVYNSALMKQAMEKAAELNVPIIDHCEEKTLALTGVINEGRVSRLLGVEGIPAAAEEIMVARDIILAKNFNLPVHLAHLSTKGSVELLRWAKENRVPVSAEVTPHHLLLTEEALLSRDPNYKVNPPLRTEEDVKALRQALKEGLIEVIATDHAPHAEDEKKLGLEKAPFGINGLETAVPALLDKLVRTGEFSLNRLIEALSVVPARLLRLQNKGRIKPGADADLTLLDLKGVTSITRETFQSKSLNTPYLGSQFQGTVAMTIVNGRVVYPVLD